MERNVVLISVDKRGLGQDLTLTNDDVFKGICPNCKRHRILWRTRWEVQPYRYGSWREVYLCGRCRQLNRKIDYKIKRQKAINGEKQKFVVRKLSNGVSSKERKDP